MEADLEKLGKVIERERRRAVLSAREVAEEAGISPAYVRTIERAMNPKTGKPSKPSVEALLGIARALSLPPGELLTLAGYSSEAVDDLQVDGGHLPARGAIEDLLRQIQLGTRGLNRRSDFIRNRAIERLDEFTAEFRAMASGTLRCPPEQESHLTRVAARSCKSELRAVSYQDGIWWRSPEGDLYLELHAYLKTREVDSTRVFITDRDSIRKLKDILQRHLDLQITTYVLTTDQVPDHYWRDFVVYDDVLLRTGSLTDPETEKKYAEFTDDRGRVTQAIQDFKALCRIGESSFAEVSLVLAHIS